MCPSTSPQLRVASTLIRRGRLLGKRTTWITTSTSTQCPLMAEPEYLVWIIVNVCDDRVVYVVWKIVKVCDGRVVVRTKVNVCSMCTTKLVSVDGGKRQYLGRFVDAY